MEEEEEEEEGCFFLLFQRPKISIESSFYDIVNMTYINTHREGGGNHQKQYKWWCRRWGGVEADDG